MQISFLIVTKNRLEDLAFTLKKLELLVDLSIHEVLVFVDGCSETETIISNFSWVKWTVSKKSISASPARNVLYKKAKGDVFIGLDDDAHPLSLNFIKEVKRVFSQYNNLGIIAFQEIRGLFTSDTLALQQSKQTKSYFTNDFVGCGFAIKKDVYNKTNGFPVWMDIYGEESALAIEVLDQGFSILYYPNIKVNHRVNVKKRQIERKNYFRFEKQLKNTICYFLVYYPNPILKILKALWHNFKKYALKDKVYFVVFIKVSFLTFAGFSKILKHRKPIKKETLKIKQDLQLLNYST